MSTTKLVDKDQTKLASKLQIGDRIAGGRGFVYEVVDALHRHKSVIVSLRDMKDGTLSEITLRKIERVCIL